MAAVAVVHAPPFVPVCAAPGGCQRCMGSQAPKTDPHPLGCIPDSGDSVAAKEQIGLHALRCNFYADFDKNFHSLDFACSLKKGEVQTYTGASIKWTIRVPGLQVEHRKPHKQDTGAYLWFDEVYGMELVREGKQLYLEPTNLRSRGWTFIYNSASGEIRLFHPCHYREAKSLDFSAILNPEARRILFDTMEMDAALAKNEQLRQDKLRAQQERELHKLR